MAPLTSGSWIWGRSMSKNKNPYGPLYRDAVLDLAIARGAKHSRLNVLRAILSFCNAKTGQAYPGNKKIMERAGIASKGTLDTSLRWLKEAGLIQPVAYETGGHGRCVVWGFGLTAWSTPDTVRTSLKNGEVDSGNNLPKNCDLPPQNLERTSLKIGEPTERTERTEGSAAVGDARNDTPSRREGDKVPDPIEREHDRLLTEYLRTMGYGEARRLADDWKRSQRATA